MHPFPTRASRLARAVCLAALALVALPAGTALAAPVDPPAPQLTVNPGAYDFGIVELNRGGSQNGFNVQNVGLDWVQLSTQITGPDADGFRKQLGSARAATRVQDATYEVELGAFAERDLRHFHRGTMLRKRWTARLRPAVGLHSDEYNTAVSPTP